MNKKQGRPPGYEKTGGIVRGQTWDRPTKADRIWRALNAEPQRPIHLARRLHLSANTVKSALRLWLRRGALKRLPSGYRRGRRPKDRPPCS